MYVYVLFMIETYLSALSARAPALMMANTAASDPAEAAQRRGCRPSLSITSTEDLGWANNMFKISNASLEDEFCPDLPS